MYKDKVESLRRAVSSLRQNCGNKDRKRLRVDMLARCVERVIDFADGCDKCGDLIVETERVLLQFDTTSNRADQEISRTYQYVLKSMVSHLKDHHKLVSDGHYVGTYMSLGVAMGIPFGLMFANIALGIPIGLCIGTAIGSSMDADAKKKGRVI